LDSKCVRPEADGRRIEYKCPGGGRCGHWTPRTGGVVEQDVVRREGHRATETVEATKRPGAKRKISEGRLATRIASADLAAAVDINGRITEQRETLRGLQTLQRGAREDESAAG